MKHAEPAMKSQAITAFRRSGRTLIPAGSLSTTGRRLHYRPALGAATHPIRVTGAGGPAWSTGADGAAGRRGPGAGSTVMTTNETTTATTTCGVTRTPSAPISSVARSTEVR